MQKCSRCFAELANSTAQCAVCGQRIEVDVEPFTLLLGGDGPDNTPTKIPTSEPSAKSPLSTSGPGHFVSGTLLANRYRIIGLLGKGGMGYVYRAEDVKLSQEVALKFLPDELNTHKEALRRFHSEVRNARRVSHTNVCRVFDIGEADGRHFISMEFIEGDDLSSLLTRAGRLSNERAIEISRQLCVGLAAIHKAGILHRDLKPPNIIIDKQGIARITDFGIAGIETEIDGLEVSAGTPAYMAPEQITGKEVTIRSDIYSLGLVLYEIFTGKQAFVANSIPEFVRKHKSETPTTPSEHVKGIDPSVEKVISQCLEKDAADRPESALHVAMALPGGDPLRFALEHGQTPTPEMVAAIPRKGLLKPWLVIALFAASVIAFSSLVYLRSIYSIDAYTPFEKSPAMLTETARKIVRENGYLDPPIDTDSKFITRPGYLIYVSKQDDQIQGIRDLRNGQPAHYQFRYRQSPQYLTTLGMLPIDGENPPFTVPGMVSVRLDVTGRLISFFAVPSPEIDRSASDSVDWKKLFDQAGLDQSKFKQIESKWRVPLASRSILAWAGPMAGSSGIPVRVEAAEFNGRPEYFSVIATQWEERHTAGQIQGNALAQSTIPIFGLISLVLLVSLVAFALFLVRHNLNNRRGDVRGAAKIAIVCLVLYLIRDLLVSDAPPTFVRVYSIVYSLAWGLLLSVSVFCFYLAVEPYVRRRWPEALISWNRLLIGKWRDPMIGRDILIGSLTSCVIALVTYGVAYLEFGRDPKHIQALVTIGADWEPNNPTGLLNGQLGALSHIMDLVVQSVMDSSFLLVFLVVLTFILRKRSLAIITLTILFGMIDQVAAFPDWSHLTILGAALSLLSAGVAPLVLTRFGLVAAIIVGILTGLLSYPGAITLNTSSFHFPSTFIVLAVALILMTYALYISLAGQKILAGKFLEY